MKPTSPFAWGVAFHTFGTTQGHWTEDHPTTANLRTSIWRKTKVVLVKVVS